MAKRLPIDPDLHELHQIWIQRQLRISMLISLQIKTLRMLPNLLSSLAGENQQVRSFDRLTISTV